MITPVVGHATCELDRERLLRERRSESLARRPRKALPGRRRLRTWFGMNERPRSDYAAALRDAGEDVWRALRF